ncbi:MULTISPECIES: DEAD/DEAH box helicase [Shouchella]|uniref:DEAD/DEAH box helicase n=2 Tax=Shouchella TaxID=2893057 RepID=A0ABY7W4V3_9BACI|nr:MULTISPECIES: DEAD/DEAH box helicase [Shouchella]MED4127230.1 DEAD/DEAH box helicase [Shouchella miscanthi]WDF03708.1 DEAD/DEAH box helicase [Shouchella hunanensis]GAF23551.1 cold-shock DEAD-box protein A [Bacillus sp. JCM 19047]
MTFFSDFEISDQVKQAIKEMGFEEPSPIQEKAIPAILTGGDVIGQAQTGTGKTAAFGIPVVDKVTSDRAIQALILTPTRELAIQVAGELQKLSMHKAIRTLPIYGGQSIGHQIKALKQGVQIVIGTPGRMLDHLRRGTLKLQSVHTVVLDEADEMLDMGFVEDIEAILKEVNDVRQTLLFSATMPPAIRKLSRNYMNNPATVTINKGEVTAPSINQVYYKVLERNKIDSLCRIIDSDDVDLGILFCRTKKGVAELTEALQARGYLADGLHGDLTQSQRDVVMKKFRDSSIEFLIATDVAARGIDVENVSHVINFDIPQDPESYVHRIGRTGRAGRTGAAITLVTPREMKHLRSIEKEIKMYIPSQEVPTIEDVVEKQQTSWKNLIKETIESGGKEMELFRPLADQMLEEEVDAKEIISALLKLKFSTETASEDAGYSFGETGGAKGMVRFFINVGRNVNLTPKILGEEISRLIGIPVKTIGRIDIFDNFSFVDVPEESAPFAYEGLRYSRINGARVNLEPAKPRPKRERRPHAAGRRS